MSSKKAKDQLESHDAATDDHLGGSQTKQFHERSPRRNQIPKPSTRKNSSKMTPERPSRSRPQGQPTTPQATAPDVTAASSSDDDNKVPVARQLRKAKGTDYVPERGSYNTSDELTEDETCNEKSSWKKRKEAILRNLPAGIDESAAK